MDIFILQGFIDDKLIDKPRTMTKKETIFLPKICMGTFDCRFTKLLNKANINTNHADYEPSTAYPQQ